MNTVAAFSLASRAPGIWPSAVVGASGAGSFDFATGLSPGFDVTGGVGAGAVGLGSAGFDRFIFGRIESRSGRIVSILRSSLRLPEVRVGGPAASSSSSRGRDLTGGETNEDVSGSSARGRESEAVADFFEMAD